MAPETEAVLRAAGWMPGRRVDIAPFVSAYPNRGKGMPEPILRFLEEFAGLRIVHAHARRPALQTDIIVDPVLAIRRVAPEWIADWSERVGEELTVVGEARRGHLTLLMDALGHVFGGFDDFLTQLGANPVEAMDTLVMERGSVQIGARDSGQRRE